MTKRKETLGKGPANGGYKDQIKEYHRSNSRKASVLLILVASVFFLMLLSVNAGAAKMSFTEVFRTLIRAGDEKSFIVIWRIRMPRVVSAVIAGAGLSIAGCVMQTCLKNPLASPSTLGISSAATFGANLAIIGFGAGAVRSSFSDSVTIDNPYLVTVTAFAFSFAAVLLILFLSKLRGFSVESIVLAGVALSSLFGAGTTLLQYFGDDVQVSAALFWTFGDLGRISWTEALILSVITVGALFYFLFMRWDYNALEGGEDLAKSLGVRTDRVRFLGLLVSSLITAISVSFMGMIGFIGLISPQIMRRIIGSDHRYLIPGSALMGAALLLLADTASRTVISPIVLPVGAVTSLFGAPMFFYILLKGKKVR